MEDWQVNSNYEDAVCRMHFLALLPAETEAYYMAKARHAARGERAGWSGKIAPLSPLHPIAAASGSLSGGCSRHLLPAAHGPSNLNPHGLLGQVAHRSNPNP